MLSLSAAARKPGKSGDWLTRKDAEQMVAQAIASNVPQIHEFYLNQLPTFVARMIQDALLSYGLIAPIQQPDIGGSPDNIKVDAVSEDPAQREARGDAESTPAPVVQP